LRQKVVKYLYITGASYCGSTLLAFLLNSHPRMASISEPEGPIPGLDPSRYLCSCGELLPRCPFYRKIEERVRDMGGSFSVVDWRTRFQLSRFRPLDVVLARPLRNHALDRIRFRLLRCWGPYRRRVAEIAERNYHLARAILEETGKEVYVDAQKDPARIPFLLTHPGLDLYVLHLVRDVRGSALSFLKHHPGHSLRWAVRRWLVANENADRARSFLPPARWLRVTYDSLCADAEKVTAEISRFVGVEPAPVPDDFYRGEHHILGNQMRLQGTGRIRKDDSWREKLGPEELRSIARWAGEANRRFGHSWP